jgi:hypothetical protein
MKPPDLLMSMHQWVTDESFFGRQANYTTPPSGMVSNKYILIILYS